MSEGGGAYFDVEYDGVARVAGRLTEVADALEAAAVAAADLTAVSGTDPGFTSVDAALACATAWLEEVARLGGGVDSARADLSDSLSVYQGTDLSARDSFAWLDASVEAEPW